MSQTKLTYIQNPHKTTKRELFDIGVYIMEAFCKKNFINRPRLKTVSRGRSLGYYKYHSGVLVVNPKQCRMPIGHPNDDLDIYPGFIRDHTTLATVIHEFGHYVHDYFGHRFVESRWVDICASERPASTYEPNIMESFAEAMRLFILNPTLLEEGRPMRYHFIREVMDFRPIIKSHYKETLLHLNNGQRFLLNSWLRKDDQNWEKRINNAADSFEVITGDDIDDILNDLLGPEADITIFGDIEKLLKGDKNASDGNRKPQ